MMTREEMAVADREYARLPGTPPNGYSFISCSEFETLGEDAFQAAIAKHPEANHCRLTSVNDGFWFEFWDVRPFKEADFNPPMAAWM